MERCHAQIWFIVTLSSGAQAVAVVTGGMLAQCFSKRAISFFPLADMRNE